MNNFIVVCLIGQPGSGKDTLADFLAKEKNFQHISMGNIIREEMKNEGLLSDNRENMRIFSKRKREKMGNQYPANIASERIVGNTVISGPRNLAEVNFFQNRFGQNFLLVAVDAPIEIRYQRVKNRRGRTGDNLTFEEFKAQEEAELNSGTHELSKLSLIADYSVDNSRDKEDMFARIDYILKIKSDCILLQINHQRTLHYHRFLGW
jgi:dephospho-CoA kinase